MVATRDRERWNGFARIFKAWRNEPPSDVGGSLGSWAVLMIESRGLDRDPVCRRSQGLRRAVDDADAGAVLREVQLGDGGTRNEIDELFDFGEVHGHAPR